jgi:hypothetical protein
MTSIRVAAYQCIDVMIRQRGRYGPLVTRHLDSALSTVKSVILTAQNAQNTVISGETKLIDFDEFLLLLVREHCLLLCAVTDFKERALCNNPVWGVTGRGAGTGIDERRSNSNNNQNKIHHHDYDESRATDTKVISRHHRDRDDGDDREFIRLNMQLLRFSGYHSDDISVNYLSYFPLQVAICEMNELFHELVNNDDERRGYVDINTFESAVLYLHRLSRGCSPTHRILPSDDISVFLRESKKRFRCGPNFDKISYLAVWGTVLSHVVQNMDIIGYSVVVKRGDGDNGRECEHCADEGNSNYNEDGQHGSNDSNDSSGTSDTSNNKNNDNKYNSNTVTKKGSSLPLTLPQLLLTAITERQRGLDEERASALLGYLGSMQCVVNTTSIPSSTTSYSNGSTFALGSTTSFQGYSTSFPSNIASTATTRPSSPSMYATTSTSPFPPPSTSTSPLPPPSTSTSTLPPDYISASDYFYPPGPDPLTAKNGTGTRNDICVEENAILSHLPLSGFWRPHTGETTEI